MRYFLPLLAMMMGITMDASAQVKTTDSTFIQHARPIPFVVNKINISEKDKRWITDSLIPKLQALGDKGIILGRAAASPEGPTANNRRLAQERKASMDALLGSYGINTQRIRYDVVAEDYPLLRSLMWLEHDTQLSISDSLIKQYGKNTTKLKEAMKRIDEGRFWKRILKVYFPKLRAVRIMAIDQRIADGNPLTDIEVPKQTIKAEDLLQAVQAPQVAKTDTLLQQPPKTEPKTETVAETRTENPRRELLSIKTNLLFDFAYMPGYNRFCPIPNVAIEYYPLHGHFTYGASFDGPWWQHYEAHKYFQLRNYQLHSRYYFRNGDISLRKPGEGAAYKGWFVSAYAHAYLYNICFGEKRGWEGEGWGAGLGIGYVLPLGKKEHWRLEFGLQAGYLQTDYDPYQWRCPIDPGSDVERYYYKWYGDAKDFKKRQHRYSWMGPTRVEVTLSYDLLYRKRNQTK